MKTSDEQIGRNLQTLRGDMSQKDLAAAMRGAGFKWSQATVWSVEKGERPLRLTEAEAVAQILDASTHQLTTSDEDLRVIQRIGKVVDIAESIADLSEDLYEAQRWLAITLDLHPGDDADEVEEMLLRKTGPDFALEGLFKADAAHRAHSELVEFSAGAPIEKSDNLIRYEHYLARIRQLTRGTSSTEEEVEVDGEHPEAP